MSDGEASSSTPFTPAAIVTALAADPKTNAGLVAGTAAAATEATVEPISGIGGPSTVSGEELNQASDREERKGLIGLRRTFSLFLLSFMAGQLLFMNVVLILSSTGTLTVPASVLQFYLAGTFGQIVAMVTVAVRFLFSDKPFLGKH